MVKPGVTVVSLRTVRWGGTLLPQAIGRELEAPNFAGELPAGLTLSAFYSFTGTAPAVRMRSAASLLVAKSTKACACSDRVTLLLVTNTKGR